MPLDTATTASLAPSTAIAIPTEDYILYRRDDAGNRWREETVLHVNSDGDTIATIAKHLTDWQDDGETVRIYRVSFTDPARCGFVTAEVAAVMLDTFEREYWLHPGACFESGEPTYDDAPLDEKVHPLILDAAMEFARGIIAEAL